MKKLTFKQRVLIWVISRYYFYIRVMPHLIRAYIEFYFYVLCFKVAIFCLWLFLGVPMDELEEISREVKDELKNLDHE